MSDAVGTRTFTYNNSFRLVSEAMSGLYSKTITRDYSSSGVVGRDIGFHIGVEYDVAYGYDSHGRLDSLGTAAGTFLRTYLANSDLPSSINYPNSISVAYEYEARRDLITSVENKYGAGIISKYAYGNDALDRRASVVNTGSAFTQNNYTAWQYNSRSELTQARKYQGTDTEDTTTPINNYNFSFLYDSIGNRNSSTSYESGLEVNTNYTANNLNLYTTAGGNSPTYDNDGNMLNDGTRSFAWDAENRLKAIANGAKTIEYKYDYLSRRVEKKVAEAGTVSKHLRFVYDGYKMIEELDAASSNAVRKKVVWNGEEPFSIYDTILNATYYYMLDANKNVSELVDENGNIVAHYEYSPFGKIINQSGSYADENPIRYSAEYFDSETDLVYYNYRYYNPELGRWLSRDPVEEESGWNLYAICANNMINYVDMLGNGDWQNVPGSGQTQYRGPETHPGTEEHIHIKDGKTEYGRRITKDGTQKPDGKSKAGDVPKKTLQKVLDYLKSRGKFLTAPFFLIMPDPLLFDPNLMPIIMPPIEDSNGCICRA